LGNIKIQFKIYSYSFTNDSSGNFFGISFILNPYNVILKIAIGIFYIVTQQRGIPEDTTEFSALSFVVFAVVQWGWGEDMRFELKRPPDKMESIYKTLYIKRSLVDQVEKIAVENKTSFNNVVVSMIESCLKEE